MQCCSVIVSRDVMEGGGGGGLCGENTNTAKELMTG